MSLIYLLIFGVILVASYNQFTGRNVAKQWYIIIIIIMSLVAGLGYALSPDWFAYYDSFVRLGYMDWSYVPRFSELMNMERGYLTVNKILGDFGFDFGMVTLLIATVSLILKSSTIYKYGGYYFLALFIYAMPTYMFEEHIHIRQGIATAIAFYSIRYIIDKNLIRFLFCIIIAFQFHESVLVFTLAYWLANMKFNEKTIGWLVAFSIIGFYTGFNSIIEVIMEFMPVGQDKFEDYQSDLYMNTGVAVGDFVKIITVISIIIYNRYAAHDPLYCIFRNLYIIGVLLYFFLGKGIFGIRLPGYYTIFLGMTVSRLVYSFDGNNFKRNFVYFSFVSYTVLLIFWFQIKQGHKSNFANYKTIFYKDAVYGLWKWN